MKFNPLFKVVLVPVLVWCGFTLTTRLSRQATLRQGDEFRRLAVEADAKLRYSSELSTKSIRRAVDTLVTAAISSNKISLDTEQTVALREKLVTCVSSHSIGSVDEYVKLIAPSADSFDGWADVEYKSAMQQVISDLLTSQGSPERAGSILGGRAIQKINDPRELARIQRILFVSVAKSWTNPIFCNHCWSSIAFEDMSLRISTTPFPPTSIFEQAKSEGHQGYKNFKANKSIKPTLLDTLKKHEKISVSMFSFVVKTEEPIERHRIYASFYFSPENGDWILEEFGCGDPLTRFHYEIF
jgi:hypothetical protein